MGLIGSDSADAVAAIHVLEHFYRWEVPDILEEWRRILKPGGKMILELPSMDKCLNYIILAYKNREPLMPFMTTHAFWGDPDHQSIEMTHKWGWFKASLQEVLEHAGMREIRFMPPKYHFQFRDMRVEAIK